MRLTRLCKHEDNDKGLASMINRGLEPCESDTHRIRYSVAAVTQPDWKRRSGSATLSSTTRGVSLTPERRFIKSTLKAPSWQFNSPTNQTVTQLLGDGTRSRPRSVLKSVRHLASRLHSKAHLCSQERGVIQPARYTDAELAAPKLGYGWRSAAGPLHIQL